MQNAIKEQILKNNVRAIAVGEQGMKKKMLLVRPNVVVGSEINLEWEIVCRRLRTQWQTERTTQTTTSVLPEFIKTVVDPVAVVVDYPAAGVEKDRAIVVVAIVKIREKTCV